jgi:hemoglobin
MSDVPTIYEWAGGHEAFARWLNAFYDPVEQEPEPARLFG